MVGQKCVKHKQRSIFKKIAGGETMRQILDFCSNWYFSKENGGAAAAFAGDAVTLPHTWNAKDGQDGGNDYYRGTCWYAKKFTKAELPEAERLYLEFEGVAMTADVYVNDQKLAHHEGGYSTFRVDITDVLQEENVIAVSADNSDNEIVYPQKADFTFYGGIYRPVKIVAVPAAHFTLDYHGGSGVKVTPKIEGSSAEVTIEAWVTGDAKEATFTVYGADQCPNCNGISQIAAVEEGKATAVITIPDVHLWDGIEDPYLYAVKAVLDSGDETTVKFGCRTFSVDPEKGFFLNGRSYPLCGAARHQDRQGVGYAITPEMHKEDLEIILEMGANTVRLAHYQHAQYFYDLCDEAGLIAWAEIPYITRHMDTGYDNTISQMTELVIQNYNHPSIICWGLSNEITASGGVTEELIANHKALNDLCHKLDATRPTTMAHVFMLDPNSDFVMLPDIRSYNLYYGWYIGEVEQNDEWFDTFHKDHPEAVIGLSEYGADANPAYQSANPTKGDWTESYQAVYHEHMLKMWKERPYIWAMHVWNMFDFGADGRDEGGKPGQNQKGLVTFDRKTKKDAFYIYKAYLSKEAFVHICGRRYVNRHEEVTEIKVYSNQDTVTLYVDGVEKETKTGDKIFKFEVPITGEHTIKAVSGDLTDEITIKKVAEKDPSYVKEGGEVENWFDRDDEVVREGYYSIADSMATLKQNPAAAALVGRLMEQAKKSYGDVAQAVQMPEAIQRQMDMASLKSMIKQASKAVTPEMVKQLNDALNQIPRN